MTHNKERLLWQCRRGMLELDMLLENFLEQHFQHLSAEQQANFIQLLEQPDPFLFSWIMEGKAPQPFTEIVKLIRTE